LTIFNFGNLLIFAHNSLSKSRDRGLKIGRGASEFGSSQYDTAEGRVAYNDFDALFVLAIF
jgi:hypothetical protein